MPKQGEHVRFKQLEYRLPKPHVIYADFESRLVKVDVKKGENTVQTQVHKPIGYCYRVVFDVDTSENVTVQYTAKTNDEDVYLDANNLYGWVMSKPLPVGNFKWMTRDELGLLAEEMPPCFIKVDIEYPENLHEKFSELVPAPDKIVPEGSGTEFASKKGLHVPYRKPEAVRRPPC